jgi:hypothetical protein
MYFILCSVNYLLKQTLVCYDCCDIWAGSCCSIDSSFLCVLVLLFVFPTFASG